MRDSTTSTIPPKKPAASPTRVAKNSVNERRSAGDQQGIQSAIEQAGHDVPALIVGTEKIVAKFPSRSDRRVAKTKTFGRLFHDRHVLPVDLDDGIER